MYIYIYIYVYMCRYIGAGRTRSRRAGGQETGSGEDGDCANAPNYTSHEPLTAQVLTLSS